jgi:hypothetical protein
MPHRSEPKAGELMSSAAAACAELLRVLFDRLREIEKNDPRGVEQVVATMVAHLRSWRPESVSPLGTLPEPEGSRADPRAMNAGAP